MLSATIYKFDFNFGNFSLEYPCVLNKHKVFFCVFHPIIQIVSDSSYKNALPAPFLEGNIVKLIELAEILLQCFKTQISLLK